MEGKKKKKDTGEESPGYEDLLDGFAFEQRTDEKRTDFDGLALAELLGDEGGPKMPDEPKEDDAGSGAVEDYSDLARQFETLDLNALDTVAEEEPVAQSETEPETEQEPEGKNSFDGSLELGEDDLDAGSGYASLLDSIGDGNQQSQAAEPAEFSLDDLHLDEVPDTVDGTSAPIEDSALDGFDFSGFSLDDFKSPDEEVSALPDESTVPETCETDDLKLEGISEEASDIDDLIHEEVSEEVAGLDDLKLEVLPEEILPGVEVEDDVEMPDVVDISDEISVSADEPPMADEEFSAESSAAAGVGYAAALGDMFGGIQSDAAENEPVMFDAGTGDEASTGNLFETEPAEEALSMAGLLGGTDEEEIDQARTTELKAVEESAPEPEHDFLGLSSLGAAPEQKREETKKTRGKTETLYDGVEMDFDEQIAVVTLAELLFAQGKKKEAGELFVELSKKKGVTSWVAKRLRALTSTQDR